MRKIATTAFLLLLAACAKDYGDLTEVTHKNIDKIVGWGTVCENGTVRDLPCGLNFRGERPQLCVKGAWSWSGECVDPDECLDDDTRVVEKTNCLDTIGDQPQKCIEGHWGNDGLCILLAPTIMPDKGDFYPHSTESVAITTETEGATIRYTFDDSEPTSSTGYEYTGPIAVSAIPSGYTAIKARSFREGMADSYVATGMYRVVRIPCTGQAKCYNNFDETTCPAPGAFFYGQDAQYAALGICVPKSYTVNGTIPEEIVVDNNKGLQWQKTLSGITYTWDGAIAYCDDLTYSGYSDWRLPNDRELESIVDAGYPAPSIDTDTFPGTPMAGFWSSSSRGDKTNDAWCVQFSNGLVTSYIKTTVLYARCVRGKNWWQEGSFIEEPAGEQVVVADSATGLAWTKEYTSISMTWQSALIYCEELNYAGHADWRLPNIDELKTLINRGRYSPASDFPDMPSMLFWSSSSRVSGISYAWSLGLGSGTVTSNFKTDNIYARCVR